MKPALFGSIVSLSIDFIPLECRGFGSSCAYECDASYENYLIIALVVFLIVLSFLVSLYSSKLLLSKLRINLKNQLKDLRWSFFRLSVFPYITIICLLPYVVSNLLFFYKGKFFGWLLITSTFLMLSIGFLNSVVIRFTREFKDALKFKKKIKIRPLVSY